MQAWFLLFGFVLVSTAAWIVLLRRPKPFTGFESLPPYRIRKALLSSNERSFYKVLKDAVGGRSLIFPKVCLSQILDAPGQDPSFRSHWQRVQRRGVDFLVCDTTLTPILAIKLDPNARRRRKAKEDVLDDALDAADLPLLRIRPAEQYDVEEITYKIRFALANNGSESLLGLDSPRHDDTDPDSFVNVHFPKFRRWTSDLWDVASRRAL